MSDTDNFEKRVKGIRDWKGPEVDKLEAVHMIPYVIESYELITDLFTEVKRLRERLRDATDLLHDCEYYICPTCNQWADRNYNCENCKEADE